MRHSRRTTLTAEDVDSALNLRNVEVSGFDIIPSLLTNCWRDVYITYFPVYKQMIDMSLSMFSFACSYF